MMHKIKKTKISFNYQYLQLFYLNNLISQIIPIKVFLSMAPECKFGGQ